MSYLKIFKRLKSLITLNSKNIIIFYASINFEYFSGNLKYLYLHFCKKSKYKVYFLTLHKRIFNELNNNGLPVIFWNDSFKDKKINQILSKTKYVFFDYDFDYFRTNPIVYNLLSNTIKIQMWHCVATKVTNKENVKDENWKSLFYGRKKYHYIFSRKNQEKITYEDNFFKPSIKYLDLPFSRLDGIKNQHSTNELINVDLEMYNFIKSEKKKNVFNIIYCPTYRPENNSLHWIKKIDFDFIDKFCLDYNINFFINFHQSDWDFAHIFFKNKKYKKIYMFKKFMDVYPNLYFSSMLITDYSSIYVDYLVLKNPILFFRPDKKLFEEKIGLYKKNIHDVGIEIQNKEDLKEKIINIISLKKNSDNTYDDKIKHSTNFFQVSNEKDNCEEIYSYLKSNIFNNH